MPSQVSVRIELDPKTTQRALGKICTKICEDILAESQKNILELDLPDTNWLMLSGHLGKLTPVGVVEVERTVEYDAPYAGYVEYGTLPRTQTSGKYPPFENIYKWVRRKFGITNKRQATEIAWKVCNKIYYHGTDPKPYFRPAIDYAMRKYGVDINLTQKI